MQKVRSYPIDIGIPAAYRTTGSGSISPVNYLLFISRHSLVL